MIRGVFILLLILANLQGNARRFNFSGYTISDGLSQSVVTCIFQDSRGFIWLGTQNGLNCFDGYNFQVHTFSPDDSTSISNNWIYGVTEDPSGDLWIGTKGGLNRFSTKEKRFTRISYTTPYPVDVTGCIYDVQCSANGKILINTPPVLSICNPQEMTFTHYISPLSYDGSVKDYNIPLRETSGGNIWMGSTQGLARFSPSSESFRLFSSNPEMEGTLSDNNITALYQDKPGSLWVGTSKGVDRMNEEGTILYSYPSIGQSTGLPGSDFIRAIAGDASGALWIATEGGGLRRLSSGRDGRMEPEVFTTSNSGIFHDIVLSLFIDKSENLWIGTLAGINKTDLKKEKFKLYRKSNEPSSVDLSGNVIASLFKDEKGFLWIGTWGQGLNCFDPHTGRVEHYATHLQGKFALPNDYVHTIFEDSAKTIWIGTRDGLLVFLNESRSFVRPENYSGNQGLPSFQGLRIFRMISGRNGDFWIATQNGLFRKKPGEMVTERFFAEADPPHQISSNLVYNVLEDRDGLIWIGTTQGLDQFNPLTGLMKHFKKTVNPSNAPADDFITTLCEDQHGDIWIGTSSYVNRFSKKGNAFTYYGKEQGIPGNQVYGIVRDKQERIWIATGNGLCRFDPGSNSFKTYSVDEGLQSAEFNLGASFLASDGELFFGGMNGFNAFYPDSLKDNPHLPPLAFTRIWKNRKGEIEIPKQRNDHTILLDYRDYSFTVEFAALEFTNPSKNRYKYLLEGGGDEWIEIGNRNFVAFSNLPPGEYVLWVKGSNNDGIWNENGIRLNMVIRPPWWRNRFVVAAYLLLSALLALWFFRSREQHHIREKIILEEKVRERTLRIEEQKSEILQKNSELKALNASKDKFFSIIGHDLRNPFNAIIGFTDLLLIKLQNINPEELKKSLEIIRGSSRQAHELLENLLLWARAQTGSLSFRPEPADLKMLVTECITLLEPQASNKNISIDSCFEDQPVIEADVNMIRTVLRNLVTNSIKFTGQHGKIRISLTTKENKCIVSVSDNGTGIEKERLPHIFNIGTSHKTKGTDGEPGTGLGLILCKEFVEKHGGKIEVISEEGKGSEFRVFLPRK